MLKIKLFFSHALFLWLLSSCHEFLPQGVEHLSDFRDGIQSFRASHSAHFSSQSSSPRLEGSGQIIFVDPLDGVLRPHLFHISFILNSPSGHAEFVFFHTDSRMRDGIGIEFRRNPNLEVWLHQAGRISRNISEFFMDKPPSMPFHFRIALQMTIEGLQMLIWDNLHRVVTPALAILDTSQQNWVVNPTHVGSNWGVRFYDTLIIRAQVREFYHF